MKKILGILLAFMMLLSLAPSAFAASQTTLNFDLTCDGEHEVTKKAGDIITVTYAVENVTDADADYYISSMSNRVYFDYTFFEYVEGSSKVTSGLNQSTKLSVFSNANHYIYYNGSEGTAKQYAADQVIGTFQLKIIATEGSSTIRSTSTLATDKDNDSYTLASTDLVVKIGDAPVTPVYELKFETNGGTAISAIKAESGTIIELSGYTPVKSGFVLEGWYSDSGLTKRVTSVTLTENTTVYAKWTAEVKNYTLTFVTNGGSTLTAVTAKEGTTVNLSEYTTVRSGYTFTGWYSDSALKKKVTSVTLTKDTSVYAGWEKKEEAVKQYTLTFVTNGGTSVSKVTADEGTTIYLAGYTTARNGYTFTGWYSDANLRNRVNFVKLTKDTVVYAGWEKDEIDIPIIPVVPVTPDIPDDLNGAEHFAYIVGYDDGKVHPEADITRAEVATIFFRLLNEEVREQYLTRTNSFRDVPADAWYNTAVSTMAKMGILKGYEGNFRPNDPITRAEFAAIAARFADETGDKSVSFKDISGHWAELEILKAASLGWVEGYNGSYRPNDSITRAEAMTIINRVLCRIPETADDLLPGMRVWSDNSDTSKWYYLAVQEATNSHTFVYKDDTHESWVELIADPDWSKYQ